MDKDGFWRSTKLGGYVWAGDTSERWHPLWRLCPTRTSTKYQHWQFETIHTLITEHTDVDDVCRSDIQIAVRGALMR